MGKKNIREQQPGGKALARCEMSKKVLVVDDEKLIVKGIRFSLEQDGMEVDCAYDGEEALTCARNKEYDMILLE